MTNDERMTKSEAQKPVSADDSEAASTQAVDGSQGAAFDLFKNLERPKE
jgi:hypothetical protein